MKLIPSDTASSRDRYFLYTQFPGHDAGAGLFAPPAGFFVDNRRRCGQGCCYPDTSATVKTLLVYVLRLGSG